MQGDCNETKRMQSLDVRPRRSAVLQRKAAAAVCKRKKASRTHGTPNLISGLQQAFLWKMQIGVAHGQLRTAERRRLSIAGTTSTDINGIGPKFAEQLVAAGIPNIAALAIISDDQRDALKDEIKGDDMDAWVEQAQTLSGDASEEEE